VELVAELVAANERLARSPTIEKAAEPAGSESLGDAKCLRTRSRKNAAVVVVVV
jgi:hypothetical protein